MKRMRNFNEKTISAKKENPSGELTDALIKLRNRLYKSRLMIVAFLLGNLLMASTGYGYDVIINNTTSGGTWTGGTTGPYTFTPTANANINVSDITNRLTGNGYTAGNVTINTGAHVTTSDVIISTAITAANTTATQRTFTITAAGSITVNTSSNINLSGSSSGGSPNTPRSGTNLSFLAGTTISIGSTINTSGGIRGNGSGGNAGSISLTAGTSSGVSINGSLIANGANAGGNQNDNGGNAGNITINGPDGISLSSNLSAMGGTLTGSGINGTKGTITINDGAALVTIGGTNNGQTAGIISGGSFIKQGAGTFKLAGANTYTGATTISAGTLSIANVNNLGSATNAIVLGSASAKGSLTYTGTSDATFTRGFTVNAVGGGITNASANLLTVSTGGITNGGALTLSNTGSGGTSISSVISSSGSLTINNTGTGITTLSGTNIYAGATTISAGKLSIANVNNLGNGTSAIVLGSASAKGSLTYTGTSAATFTRGFTVNAGGGELSGSFSSLSGAIALNGPLTLSNTGNTNLSGVLSSSGSLAINNAGNTITLSNANTNYTGATSITTGTLKLDNAAALGASSQTTVSSGATLDLNGVTLTSAVPLTLSGTLSNSLSTAVNYNGAITLGAPSILAATGNITLGGGINGLFSLTKTGTGTLNTGTVLSEIGYLTIDAGKLTIPVGGKVTVAETTTVNENGSLTLESNDALTGSLITKLAVGSASVIRYMSPNRWHTVSSPVAGQSIIAFLGANGNIPKNTDADAPQEYPYERGMRGYDPINNQWGNFFQDNTTTGNIEKGKGFLVRVKGTTGTKDVTFTGTLNAGTITIPVEELEPGKWNCVGNPYTSAIAIKSGSGSSANFLDVNATDNLDPLFGAIYIWHQTAAEATAQGVYYETSGNYYTISNVPFASPDYPENQENDIQQGQAFMVKMKAGVETLSFTQAMQLHNTALALKSTNNIWPTVILKAMADSITSSTIVAFHEGMTAGLDPTYDAGLLKGGAPVEVYTRLVEDNGIPFDIQALPTTYESIVVPVGLDCTQGSQVSFSAELMHVPSACQVLLEDRLNKVFTDLAVNSYTADLMGSTVTEDRFFLHTSNTTTGMDAKGRLQNLRAWAVSNQEIKISGEVSHKAIATLYDLQGRAVSICLLQETKLNSMPLKGLKQGVYLLRVQDNNRVQVLKVAINK